MPTEPLTASVHVEARPERVFAYFTEPEAMVRWMGDYAVLAAAPGGEFAVNIKGVAVRGRYLEVEPPHRVVISWGHAGSERLPPGASTVEVRLTADGGGTRVEITHRGLPEPEATRHKEGWGYFLGRLAVAAAAGRVSRGWVGAIRPIAAAVIRHGDRILVWDDHDPVTGDTVAVPLAGGIEFGETGETAIARELGEEIATTPSRIRYLGLLEDIFVWAGEQRHELYLIYEVELADARIYELDEIEVVEEDGSSYQARWRALSDFGGSARLVPEGLLDLIQRSAGPTGAAAGVERA
jgi:uncharacterized protein YndB with AHSA1/START domain/ADP-ribose pyrophosphatase YjhB (NUDIX family)